MDHKEIERKIEAAASAHVLTLDPSYQIENAPDEICFDQFKAGACFGFALGLHLCLEELRSNKFKMWNIEERSASEIHGWLETSMREKGVIK